MGPEAFARLLDYGISLGLMGLFLFLLIQQKWITTMARYNDVLKQLDKAEKALAEQNRITERLVDALELRNELDAARRQTTAGD